MTSEASAKKVKHGTVQCIEPGNFIAEEHFYPRVLNAQLHPMVESFVKLGNERIIQRYTHLNPHVQAESLRKYLYYQPRFFRWAGADLFNVASHEGRRNMVVIETNSCPSGQKSMPWIGDENDNASYHVLLKHTFTNVLEEHKDSMPEGALAVVFDKNPMEASGYAAELASLVDEPVYLAEFYDTDLDPPVRWDDGIMSIRHEDKWIPIRAVFRYVTQKPWNRFPLTSKTVVLNPVIACLSGGRNKAVAAKAYELLNAELDVLNLEIRTPETIKDVTKQAVPLYVKSFGGLAVVKVPYSNAGQGVFTITNKEELDKFMAMEFSYDKFIVQSMVGNSTWTSTTRTGQYFHTGTIPNKKGQIFVADLRMMVGSSPDGYRPVVVYGRRSHKPLMDKLTSGGDSWDMLGTNLSVKDKDGNWTTETNRLMLMDRRDFNRLGLGVDDLIDGYVQTVLCAVAIDRMCKRLIHSETREFDFALFRSLNEDAGLLDELMEARQYRQAEEAAEAEAAKQTESSQ